MNPKWIPIALLASIGIAQAQTENTSTPKFEVTSVRPDKSPEPSKGLIQFLPGGRFISTNIPLIRVIAAAWKLPLQSQRLILAPGVRMPDDIYDMEATAEKGTFPAALTPEERTVRTRLLMQSMLQDRFKLRIHRESKEQPVYALVIGKGGPKLEKSKFQEPKCSEEFGPKFFSNPACHWLDGGQARGLHGGSVTLASVVEYLQNFTDRPLFDKTGLTGFFDIQTEGWLPMRVMPGSTAGAARSGDATGDDPDRPTLFSVFEKLGLRMESQRAVVEMFIIDHVEPPTEN